MKANQGAGVTSATHNKSGTLHAIVRATAGVPVLRFTATGDFHGRAQRIGPGNCLTKTQGCAKSKAQVYSLTPAR